MLMNNNLCKERKLFFLVTLTRNYVINKSVMPPGLGKYVLQIMRQSNGMYFFAIGPSHD